MMVHSAAVFTKEHEEDPSTLYTEHSLYMT